MSKLNVIVRSDFTILPHSNADRLELLEIGGTGGFVSVASKGQFKLGDKVIYVPIDAVLPENILTHLQKNSKVSIGSRIRTAKIRGVISQGLCLKPEDWLAAKDIEDNKDVTEILGIKKFEPEVVVKHGDGKGVNPWYQNDNFNRYTDIEHFRKHPSVIVDGEPVVITTKHHGTNWRGGIVKKPATLFFWQRMLIKLGLVPQHEFLVGSHNTIRKIKTLFSESPDMYWKIANQYNIESICNDFLKNNKGFKEIIIYGEIIGPGIQKGYDYGITVGDVALRVFDVRLDGKYQNWDFVTSFCGQYNLPLVELLAYGAFHLDSLKLAEAVDIYNDKKHHREGIVIKPTVERYDHSVGRVILKHINPQFLLDHSNSDLH